MSRTLFRLSLGALAWTYVGYPAAAAIRGAIRPWQPSRSEPVPDRVAVGIAARDEADTIAARIADVLAQEVPFELEVVVGSDGSTDRTVETVRALAAADPRVRVLDLPARGQAATQSAIAEAVDAPILVLTDAATRFAPGCLAALVEPFADPRVGCTSGIVTWRFADGSPVADHEQGYWRYERLVRRLESRAGWLSTASGAAMAIRSELVHSLDRRSPSDLQLALLARMKGWQVFEVEAARAADDGYATLGATFRGRARMTAQALRAHVLVATDPRAWERPGTLVATWSHKPLRYATPWLGALAVLAAWREWRRGRTAYALPVAGAGAAVGLGVAAAIAPERTRRTPGARAALTALVVSAAFARGWLDAALGRVPAEW